MNKRGISTIISSILLILLVISLFSVIVYFVKTNSEKAIEQGSEGFEKMINCDEVDLEISSVCFSETVVGGCGMDKVGICDIIQVMVKNNNKLSYNEGFRLKLSTGYSDTFKVVENSLEPYSARYISSILPIEEKRENINWIKLYPVINGQTCDSKEYKFDIKVRKDCECVGKLDGTKCRTDMVCQNEICIKK